MCRTHNAAVEWPSIELYAIGLDYGCFIVRVIHFKLLDLSDVSWSQATLDKLLDPWGRGTNTKYIRKPFLIMPQHSEHILAMVSRSRRSSVSIRLH
jgi:hypothetical protein